MISEEQYIKDRIDSQVEWYDRKADINKILNMWTKTLIILFSAFISVFSGFGFRGHITEKNILLGVLGASIAVLSGLSHLLKFQEKWAQYRATSESLMQEKMLFSTNSGPYDTQKDIFKLLVPRIEGILGKENTSWSKYINKEEGK